MLFKSFSVPLLFFLISFSMCRKGKENRSPEEVLLRDKPLTEAKSIVQGHWKMHFAKGGYTGGMRIALNESYFKVLTNDSVYMTLQGQLTAAGKAFFERRRTTNFSWEACLINFQGLGGAAYTWIIDSKIGDTLVLVDDATNPTAHLMTRIP